MSAHLRGLIWTLFEILSVLVAALMVMTGLAGLGQALGIHNATGLARKLLPFLFLSLYGIIIWKRLRASLDGPSLGLSPGGVFREVGFGFGIGAFSLLVLNGVLWAVSARLIEPELSPLRMAWRLSLAVVHALFLALVEEFLFRGVVHARLVNSTKAALAIPIGALLFGFSHFLRPPDREFSSEAWRVGLQCLEGVVKAASERPMELLGLILVGVVLGIVRVRRDSIWLGVGLHAGWVFLRVAADKSLSEVKEVVRPHVHILGTMRNYDGLLGWGALVISALIACSLRRTGNHSHAGQESAGSTRSGV